MGDRFITNSGPEHKVSHDRFAKGKIGQFTIPVLVLVVPCINELKLELEIGLRLVIVGV